MDRSQKIKFFSLLALFLFLYHPYFLLLFSMGNPSLPRLDETLWALKNSAIQTSISVILSLILGSIIALGSIHLIQQHSKLRELIRWILLLPALLPSLVLISYFLKVFSFMSPGNFSVILIQSFVGTSVVASIFSERWQQQFSGYSELALIEGSSKAQFIAALLKPIAKDWWYAGAGLFLTFWTSFAIPLLVGGNSGTNLEVLIFEKMRVSAEWSQALGLSLLQVLLLSLLFYFTPRTNSSSDRPKKTLRVLPSKKIGRALFLLLAAFVLSLFVLFFQGIVEVSKNQTLIAELDRTMAATVFTFFMSFFIFVVLYLLLIYLWLSVGSEKLLKRYLAPSTALLAVAYSSVTFFSNQAYLSYVIAACFYFFVPGYQIYFQGQFEKFEGQIKASRLMGASSHLILIEVLWPQLQNLVFFSSFISSAWLILDFTLPRFFLNQNILWSSLASSLLQTYRTELAFGVIGIMLAMLTIFFLVFQGVRFVVDKKFK